MTRWTDVDGPVLQAVAEHEETCPANGVCSYAQTQVASDTGLSESEVTASLRRLHDAGLILPEWDSSRGPRVDWRFASGLRATGIGLQRIQEWPPDVMVVQEVEDLAAYLETLASGTDDTEQSERIRAVGRALAGMSKDVMAQVIAAVVTYGAIGA